MHTHPDAKRKSLIRADSSIPVRKVMMISVGASRAASKTKH
jgi:hypothetical protein